MARKNKNHHLVKRGNTWYFRMNGTKFSLHTPSVVEARRKRDEYYREMLVNGRIVHQRAERAPEFGEVAVKWFELNKTRLKKVSYQDYRNSMNNFILPRFANCPIDQITYMDIEMFKSSLGAKKRKRIINILVPMRSVFRLAMKAGYIDKNPMDLLDPIEAEKPDIHPLSYDEILLFLEHVDPFYEPFFTVAFFTGLRFSEASALKWSRVDFDRGIIKVREARVRDVEDRTKTAGSTRDVKMFPMVVEALKRQKKRTHRKSPYVFVNKYGKPLKPCPTRKVAWTPTLEKAGLEYRTMMHTRHTYITMMLDNREHIGWIARQVGHTSPKMILERYYSYIKDYQNEDGHRFMAMVDRYEKKKSGKKCPTFVPPAGGEKGLAA